MERPVEAIAPPPNAYLYFPAFKDQKTKAGKDGRRFIFRGSTTTYDQFEKQKLDEFRNWLLKAGKTLTPRWTEDQRLLVLQSASYKNEQSFALMQQYEKWRQQSIPKLSLTDRTQTLLKKGVIYLMGRCHRWRPIYVLNITAQLFVAQNIEDLKYAVCFFFQTVIREMMLPGQVQNWICVVNVNNLGVMQLPLKVGNSVVTFMQNNYRGRLFKMFAVNVPFAVSLAYKTIKPLLDQSTRDKIMISSGNTLQKIEAIANMSQIQKKFGGKLQDVKEFFPIRLPNPDNESKEVPLITKEEYLKMYEGGLLKGNKVYPGFVPA